MHKVTVIGAGNVGATCAFQLAERNVADVTMIDIVEGMPQGKALDMAQCGAIFDFDARVEGSNDLADVKGSDVVVVTSGIPRKPGMDRMDLLKINAGIMRDVATNIKEHAPNAIVVVITNPLDIMAYAMLKVTGFPRERVIGMAGVLDAARFRRFIAWEFGCSIRDVNAMVLGGHGDQMVPLPRFSTVNGIAITELISEDRIAALCDRTRTGGGEIVKLLKTGSAFYAPAGSGAVMVEAILRDTGHLVPACAFLQGEYGYSDLFMGVPVKLGREGLKEIIELDLSPDEKKMLDVSADAVRKGIEDVAQFL
ncbi:MAG: malate dehydrogenase [Planctomycetota bacterium]|jgi:malate dehydrogenase